MIILIPDRRIPLAKLLVFSLLRGVCSATPEAEELKTVLTCLSGKSRKRGKPPTAGILLSGLFVLLQVLDYLDSMGNDLNQIAKLRVLLKKSLPNFIKDGEILLPVEGQRAASADRRGG
ncbi:MAG: hypothetical protein LBT05_08100 [Planctomycetaceae bacterium]|jgi:hypothetical protein|nr:hypothetical protein [Planctomycetaceae bacterium]